MVHTKPAIAIIPTLITVLGVALVGGVVYYFRVPIGSEVTNLKDKVVGLVSPSVPVPIVIITPTPFPTTVPTQLPQVNSSPVSSAAALPEAGPAENVAMASLVGCMCACVGTYVRARYALKMAVRKIVIAEEID